MLPQSTHEEQRSEARRLIERDLDAEFANRGIKRRQYLFVEVWLSRVWRRAFDQLSGSPQYLCPSPREDRSARSPNCCSALGHYYLSNVTGLHREEVAESDFAACSSLGLMVWFGFII
jgi:hypothetical protein